MKEEELGREGKGEVCVGETVSSVKDPTYSMSLCLSLIILIVLENMVRVSVWQGQKNEFSFSQLHSV